MPEYPKTPIQKFNTPGQEAVGPFMGIRKGKFDSNLIQIGDVTYGSSKVLDDRFRDVAVGTQAKVIYTGLVYPKEKIVNGQRYQGKPYKGYDISFPGTNGPIAQPADTDDTGDLAFTLLLSRVKLAKGDHIANILKSACELSNDPMEALQSALKQMGAADLLV